jgi:hypothetical protein
MYKFLDITSSALVNSYNGTLLDYRLLAQANVLKIFVFVLFCANVCLCNIFLFFIIVLSYVYKRIYVYIKFDNLYYSKYILKCYLYTL